MGWLSLVQVWERGLRRLLVRFCRSGGPDCGGLASQVVQYLPLGHPAVLYLALRFNLAVLTFCKYMAKYVQRRSVLSQCEEWDRKEN